MIEENNRNIRTLIVSFVIAIMALIPLRFMELSESEVPVVSMSQMQVLGESSEIPKEMEARIEAPYDEIESMGSTEGIEVRVLEQE